MRYDRAVRLYRLVALIAFTQHPRPAYPPEGSDPDVMGYSVRTDRFRYTEWRRFSGHDVRARELYDHQQDPRETVNLASDPTMSRTIERLASRLPPKTAPAKRED